MSNSRLLEAHFDVRVRFTENQVTQEFIARADATRQAPMVVNFESDNTMKPNPPGGKLILESRGSIFTTRRVVSKLTPDTHAAIEKWLEAKRLGLEEAAEIQMTAGAKAVKISEDGKVHAA